jgi:hypothetical protein
MKHAPEKEKSRTLGRPTLISHRSQLLEICLALLQKSPYAIRDSTRSLIRLKRIYNF